MLWPTILMTCIALLFAAQAFFFLWISARPRQWREFWIRHWIRRRFWKRAWGIDYDYDKMIVNPALFDRRQSQLAFIGAMIAMVVCLFFIAFAVQAASQPTPAEQAAARAQRERAILEEVKNWNLDRPWPPPYTLPNKSSDAADAPNAPSPADH